MTSTSALSTQGFRTTVGNKKERDYSKAIPVGDIKFEEVEYQDLDPATLTLCTGLYIPADTIDAAAGEEAVAGYGNYERIVDFTFKDGIDAGRYEYELERGETTARRDFGKHISKLCRYLSMTVESLGNYEVKELAAKLNCSPADVFKRMWTSDIISLMFGARYKIQGNLQYAITTQCECPKKTIIKDDPANGLPLHNLERVKFKFYQNDEYPLFVLETEKGFNDGETQVKKLYFEPLRLYQTSKLTEKKQGATDRSLLLSEMCVGIPDSQVYGIKRGKVFTIDVQEQFGMRDRRMIEAAVGRFQFGPEPQISVECHNCMEAPSQDVYLNWLAASKSFLYDTGDSSVVDF